MTIWRVASVTPPLKNAGYAPALCFPLVSVVTCFEFVYISFYFQISQARIKPSLLTQDGQSWPKGAGICRVVVWNIFVFCSIPAEVSANYLKTAPFIKNLLANLGSNFSALICFFFRLTVGWLMYLGQRDVEMLTGASAIQRTVERLSTEGAAKKFTTVSFKVTPQGITVTDNEQK